MADYLPPSGPPPPRVPEGWKAQWNEQYKEWFYVNIYTKKSQWEQPTEPVYPSSSDGAFSGPPPDYQGSAHQPTDVKHNPYEASTGNASASIESDAELARRLQAEEDERARGSSSRSAMQDYQNPPVPFGASPSYAPQDLPPRDNSKGKGGFLGKLLGKYSGGGQHHHGHYPQQGYGGPPSIHGGGYAPQRHSQQGFGLPHGMGMGYGGGRYQQKPHKGGGMGAAGGAALGLGGGLVGGMLLADAIDDHDDGDYGGDDGDGGGSDDGGGDDGGGDD